MNAHLFFPENDLALGRNLDNYTAPAAAVRLRESGYTLPMWFMGPEDCFVAQGVDGRWLAGMRERFGMEARVYDRRPEHWTPRPWGWSRAARRYFRQIGFAPEQLPTDEALDAIRALSHRRTGLRIASELRAAGVMGTPVGTECADIEAVGEYVRRVGEAVVKLPWSTTGRGLVMLTADAFETHRTQLEGMIDNQGSVTCEPRLRGVLDLAMLFTMEQGCARYDGLSVFRNAASGSYEGNVLAPQAELERMCSDLLGDGSIGRVRDALPEILHNIIGVAYDGPLGVDMLIYDAGEGRHALDGCIELNLRNTMGHVALRFYERYCAPGSHGRLQVVNVRPQETARVQDNRLISGTLCLNPPGGAFTFTASINA